MNKYSISNFFKQWRSTVIKAQIRIHKHRQTLYHQRGDRIRDGFGSQEGDLGASPDLLEPGINGLIQRRLRRLNYHTCENSRGGEQSREDVSFDPGLQSIVNEPGLAL